MPLACLSKPLVFRLNIAKRCPYIIKFPQFDTPSSFLFCPQGSFLFRPKGSVPRARRGQSRAPFPIVKDDDFLHFRVNGYGTEAENLDEPDEDKIRRKEADIEIARRLNEHQSYSTIQKEMGVSSKTIAKVSRNLSEYSEYLDAD